MSQETFFYIKRPCQETDWEKNKERKEKNIRLIHYVTAHSKLN